MTQSRSITRFVSLFLAGLLLLTATVGPSNGRTVPVKTAVATQKTAKSGKATKTTPPKPPTATVSEAGFEGLITSAASFDFGPLVLLLPASMTMAWLRLSVPRLPRRQTPHYFFAYFRHVFGHFIAPNAP
jgi:hypothetical protein